jgi:hypothetical protein
MAHRSKAETLELHGVHPQVDGSYPIRADFSKAFHDLVAAIEKHLSFEQRLSALKHIASALGFDIDEVLRNNRFRVMTREQLIEIYKAGVDIQLHSHTHRLPDRDFDSTAYEINQNRNAVKAVLGVEKNHFCYPSGQYGSQHPEWLEKLGVASATTCDTGLNPPGTHVMLLKRFLDREDFSDIEFESEIAGVREIFRIILRRQPKRIAEH